MRARRYKIACLAGDGIGPELMAEASRAVEAVSRLHGFAVDEAHVPFGGDAVRRFGHPLPPATRAACREADAVLIAATREPALEGVKAELDLTWRVTRVRLAPEGDVALVSPVAEDAEQVAIERAFRLARERRAKVTSVGTSQEWFAAVQAATERHEGVIVEHVPVELVLPVLAADPGRFDVIATQEVFAEALSNMAAFAHEDVRMVASGRMSANGIGDLRPDPRLGARDRRPGRGQPDGHAPRRLGHARRGARRARRGGDPRAGRRRGDRRRRAHGGPRRDRHCRHDPPVHGRPPRRPPVGPEGHGVRRVKMLGSDAILRSLEAEGVDIAFGIPGGAILPLYDAFARGSNVRHVLARHEQGAGHMAEGYARASGKVGVAIATSGPGATNLVTPIADAWMDSTPLVAITGQVRTNLIGTDAFQETDAVGITLPIVKHSWLVQNVEELPGVLKAAFHVAQTGRSGPVHVDIAKDVQEAEFDFRYPDDVDLPGWKPPRPRAPAPDRSGRGGARRRREARPLRRRRDDQRRRLRRAPRARRSRRHPRRHDAHGEGRLPRLAPARTTARPACTARSGRTGR